MGDDVDLPSAQVEGKMDQTTKALEEATAERQTKQPQDFELHASQGEDGCKQGYFCCSFRPHFTDEHRNTPIAMCLDADSPCQGKVYMGGGYQPDVNAAHINWNNSGSVSKECTAGSSLMTVEWHHDVGYLVSKFDS